VSTRKRTALAACVAAIALPSAAQAYLVHVPELQLDVFVEADASVQVDYRIVLVNRGRPLDAVDIGMFHDRYDAGSITASLDGEAMTSVRPSPYVSPGVEVVLEPALALDARGVFELSATVPDMVYQDTTRDDYASLRVTPTWFGAEYVRGETQLKIAVHLPAGIDPAEILHQTPPPTAIALRSDRVVVIWEDQHTVTGPYEVGISLPKRELDRVVEMTALGLFLRWFRQSGDAQVLAWLLLSAVLGVFFFRLTGGTGWTVFLVLAAGLALAFYHSVRVHLWAWALLPIACALMVGLRRRRTRRAYLPPIASVEGGGIKRGLTAPEAAMLLELPAGRVIALVLVGLLKKRVIQLQRDAPLQVAIAHAFDVPKRARIAEASRRNVVLRSYEHAFLACLGPGRLEDIDFAPALYELGRHTAQRLVGFDVEASRDYYQRIVERAWKEVGALADLDKRAALAEKKLDWLLIRDDHQVVVPRLLGADYRPPWWELGAGGDAVAGSSSPPAPSDVSAGDVAASFAGRLEALAAQAMSSLTAEIVRPEGGVLDLSGADRLPTGFFAELLRGGNLDSGGGGGGGMSGGSGCACAGCACACACAGGGR
jgi:hypothetical protein